MKAEWGLGGDDEYLYIINLIENITEILYIEKQPRFHIYRLEIP
jgi:hypothetical protein